MKTQGKVFRYGDNVDTDVIIPARYLNITDVVELAAHAMEDIDGTFVDHVQPGDIIVAGRNFGCGSSREHAPLVLKECGIVKRIKVEAFVNQEVRNTFFRFGKCSSELIEYRAKHCSRIKIYNQEVTP